MAHELVEYCTGRAMERDVESVDLCRHMVEAINGRLLAFDFRNGPLRRKYDSIKYAVKRIEDMLYEQSLLDATPTSEAAEGGRQEGVAKRPRIGSDTAASTEAEDAAGSSILNEAEFDDLKRRMEQADEARERVIKGSRDAQKLSKQAIYSIHRGNLGQARKQLGQALEKVRELEPTVQQYPTLRPGSFSNVLEEYAEGMLFLHWMETREILDMDRMAPVRKDEYIGGLVDLTGEIGRFGVACATKRAAGDVRQCYETSSVINTLLTTMQLPTGMRKKIGAVPNNQRKLGTILYELALSESGRKIRRQPSGGAEKEGQAKRDDHEEAE